MDNLGRLLLVTGVLIAVAGGLLLLFGRMGIGLGELPGDFSWERNGTQIHVPLGTMIVLSIVLTILLNVIFRLFR